MDLGRGRGRRAGVTITDVARRAGVSTMTVSNVLNGRSQRVSESTRQRVLATIAELGYQVNLAARQLRMGRTGMVGLAVPSFAPGYFSELGSRLADRFADHGLRLVMERTGGDVDAELDALAASRVSRYDGFVLSVIGGNAADLEHLRVDTPVVLIGERTVPARFDHVLMDNIGGARQATELLLRTGSRRIVLLGGVPGSEESMPGLRTLGYRQAHAALGRPVDPGLIVASGFVPSDGYEAVRGLVAAGVPFDAVFALTDSAAIGALRALAESGLHVPGEVQVVGFDNLEAARFTVPGLTTVEPGNDEMADAICSLLLERIAATADDDAAPPPARAVMPPAHLIPRASTRRE
jgi:DNA-binding LacI/PurR family transcriptional regulator